MIPAALRRLLPSHRRKLRMEAARRLLPGLLTGKPRRAARAHLDGIVRLPNFDDVELVDGRVPWASLADLPRAHRRQLHGHAVLRDLVHAHRRTGDVAFLDAAKRMVADWVEGNPRVSPSDRMAWHDETTAMRVQSWLLLREELLSADDPWRARLEAALAEHAALLADDEFHTSGTNHGMFQDEALVTYACLVPDDPAADDYFDLGTRRLLEYFDLIITDDGVHREHSPSYHALIAGKIGRLAEFYTAAGERRTGRKLARVQRRMAHYATHVLKPDGTMPLVGDTFAHARARKGLFDSPAYRWAVTNGEEGEAPAERDVVFPDAGYAIFRDGWRTDGRGTYLHFTAAYHTSYHKHTDDLSVWIYHHGDLLTEAGPNGYDYADPYTAYGYSAHAHNSLLVDGESLERVDDRADKVHLVDWEIDDDRASATGRNGRHRGVVHERTVAVSHPEQRIEVTDRVTSKGSTHDYALLWNCAPDVVPEPTDAGIELLRDGATVAELVLTSDVPTSVRLFHGDIGARRGFRLGGGDPVPTWTVEIGVQHTRDWTVTHTILLR